MGHLSDANAAFSEIYDKNVWGKGSGVGSEPQFTTEYVAMLQRFLAQHRIKSVVDFGCGDWQFSQLIDWTGIEYRGFDIVASVIDANRLRFESANIKFEQVADGTALPSADLLICKDVLQHLPTAVVLRNLGIFKQLYPNLLITNDIFPAEGANSDIDAGQWRPLRLDQAPFNERFDVDAYGCKWTKQTCRLETQAAQRPASIALRDERRGLLETPLSLWRAAKSGILSVPILGTLARRARDALLSRNR
jgi:SAM-dependent methyltransferase